MKTFSCLALFFITVVSFAATSDRRFRLNTAIAPINLNGEAAAGATVTRQILTAAELGAEQGVNFALKMRNMEELRERIAQGEVLSLDEMTARYFPARADWQRVADWAKAQGFEVQPEDPSHMTVMTTGSVAKVQAVLQMKFARVMGTDEQEHTSAITAPAIPEEFRDCIASVLQLQPHLISRPAQAVTIRQIEEGLMLPQTFAELYNATGLGVDGTGETIVILGLYRVDPADLTLFWQTCGLPTTIAQFTQVNLPKYPPLEGKGAEETMDIEWASAMAPGADVIYVTSLSMDEVTPWIISQLAAGRSIHQVSTSYAGPEASVGYSPEMLATLSQYYAALAAVGVSFFVSSGDGGSTQLLWPLTYNPDGITSPYYPASDPSVTAVGGTTVAFQGYNPTAFLPVREGAWTLSNIPNLPSVAGQPASGGGVSGKFARPVWQTGPGVPAGNMRCVPDVAALAACNFSPYMQFKGYKLTAAGTSLSSPIWAGMCALINQARALRGMPPLGLLGPKIYPLNGTSCFNQMTTGSGSGTDPFTTTATNGAYMVGPNYTLITGLGSPNVGNLIFALTGAPPPAYVAPSEAVITITVE